MIVNAERLRREDDRAEGDPDKEVAFYMKQSNTLDNACGIIAMLHSILNNLENGVSLKDDSILSRFWAQAKEQNAMDRCVSLENANEFKQ